MKRGFYLGRFQPFHKGHVQDIKDALAEVDELIIGVGSSQEKHTKGNPFSVEERIRMIENTLVAEKISRCVIFPVPDINDHARYVEHVETLVSSFDIVFTGSDFTKKLFAEKGYTITHVTMVEGVEGTDIRRRMTHDEEWQHLVPAAVFQYLKEMDGVGRVKRIHRGKLSPE